MAIRSMRLRICVSCSVCVHGDALTELTFLLELLLNHKLPKPTREAVTARVREVEQLLQMTSVTLRQTPAMQPGISGFIPPHLVGQAPSTIAAMMKHPDLVPPVAVVAQTPAAQAALAAREDAIQQGMSGKPEKGRTSPRKF